MGGIVKIAVEEVAARHGRPVRPRMVAGVRERHAAGMGYTIVPQESGLGFLLARVCVVPIVACDGNSAVRIRPRNRTVVFVVLILSAGEVDGERIVAAFTEVDLHGGKRAVVFRGRSIRCRRVRDGHGSVGYLHAFDLQVVAAKHQLVVLCVRVAAPRRRARRHRAVRVGVGRPVHGLWTEHGASLRPV